MDPGEGLQKGFFAGPGYLSVSAARVGDQSQKTYCRKQANQEMILSQHLFDREPVIAMRPGKRETGEANGHKNEALDALSSSVSRPEQD